MLELGRMTVADNRQEAEDRARQVLDEHWTARALPVDPVKIAVAMGVEVFSAQLGNDVFGLLVNRPDGARIYSDIDQPPNRYRFTVAHELGHYVDRLAGDMYQPVALSTGRLADADPFTDAYEEEKVDVDARSDDGRGKPREIFANHFAGALLMPKQTLEEELSMWSNQLFRVAERFGVSPSALQYRRSVMKTVR